MAKVLIIEGDQFISDYLAESVKQFGYEVTTAMSAEEGLEKVGGEENMVVFFDAYLPDSPDAFEWIEKISRKVAAQAAVLVITSPNEDLKEAASKCGITTILSKPFKRSFIKGILAKADAATGKTGKESKAH